jgi:hypothetical protein
MQSWGYVEHDLSTTCHPATGVLAPRGVSTETYCMMWAVPIRLVPIAARTYLIDSTVTTSRHLFSTTLQTLRTLHHLLLFQSSTHQWKAVHEICPMAPLPQLAPTNPLPSDNMRRERAVAAPSCIPPRAPPSTPRDTKPRGASIKRTRRCGQTLRSALKVNAMNAGRSRSAE